MSYQSQIAFGHTFGHSLPYKYLSKQKFPFTTASDVISAAFNAPNPNPGILLLLNRNV